MPPSGPDGPILAPAEARAFFWTPLVAPLPPLVLSGIAEALRVGEVSVLESIVLLAAYALLLSYVFSYGLGLPLYLLLRRRVRLTWPAVSAAGALVGYLPSYAWAAVHAASDDPVSRIVSAEIGVAAFVPGALAGTAFWLLLRAARDQAQAGHI